MPLTHFAENEMDLEQIIASCKFFLCLWDRYSYYDERQHQQIDIALRLKKPFILALEKGSTFPIFIREEANVIYEFEWEGDKLEEMYDKLVAFLPSLKPEVEENGKQ